MMTGPARTPVAVTAADLFVIASQLDAIARHAQQNGLTHMATEIREVRGQVAQFLLKGNT